MEGRRLQGGRGLFPLAIACGLPGLREKLCAVMEVLLEFAPDMGQLNAEGMTALTEYRTIARGRAPSDATTQRFEGLLDAGVPAMCYRGIEPIIHVHTGRHLRILVCIGGLCVLALGGCVCDASNTCVLLERLGRCGGGEGERVLTPSCSTSLSSNDVAFGIGAHRGHAGDL